MSLGIGSTVWVFDSNRRTYPKNGTVSNAPIYREHFKPVKITGETRVSWILETEASWEQGTKINKKTLNGIWATEADVDDAVFVHDHRYRLSEMLKNCNDPGVFRALAALLVKSAEKEWRHIPW